MNVREIIIGGNTIWLVIEPLRLTGVENNNFICFYKFSPPNDFSYGELLKRENGHPMEFDTIERAVEYASSYFNNKIFYKHPLNYKKEELQKILNIPMRIKYVDQGLTKEIIGTITDFSVAHNPPNLPFDLHIETSENDLIAVNIFAVERFRNL